MGKPNLRSGGPSSQKNVTPDGRLRKTLSMNLPRIQLEIYELWKTCRVPASCDFQPRILLSANKTWRQHNAWLAANELNYEAGVWRGRKRMNDWGARQREGRARTKGRNPCLPFFLARPYPPTPFHYSLKCLLHRLQFRGVNQQNFSSTWCNYRLFENGPCEKENAMNAWARKDGNSFFPSFSRSFNILTRPYPPFTPFQMLDTGYKSGGWTNKT